MGLARVDCCCCNITENYLASENVKHKMIEKQKVLIFCDFTDYLPWLLSLYISNAKD